jgi:hypothetical protein
LNNGSAWGNQHEGQQWVQNQEQNNKFSITDVDSFDVLKFIEQQITQVEPSPAKGKLE